MARKRSWTVLVAEGREALTQQSDTCWRLGDLALEVEPMVERGVNTGSVERLRRYAEELDMSYGALQTYRYIARAWPPDERLPGVSLRAHIAAAQKRGGKDVLRRLYAERGPRVVADDVNEALGQRSERQLRAKARDALGRVRVEGHERRLPGSVTPITDAPSKAVMPKLKTREQVSEFLRLQDWKTLPWIAEEVWKVLEEREKKAA